MSNPIKNVFDKVSLIQDIEEREYIIGLYNSTGFLNRDEAIRKIETIQINDPELGIATKAKQLTSGWVDLHKVGNDLIIANMQFQVDFLKLKLDKKALEEKDNG